MVYVINGQDCNPSDSFNLASIRNRLFTAISRSKAWVRVLGVGPEMEALSREYQRLWDHGFELRFRYPTEEERSRIRTVHRDMTGQEKKRLEERARGLKGLIEDLEVGRIQPEDLDEGLVQKLNELMNRGAESHA
jgi:superfamily I DNA and RNA helicase